MLSEKNAAVACGGQGGQVTKIHHHFLHGLGLFSILFVFTKLLIPLWLLPTWYTSTQSENETSLMQSCSKHCEMLPGLMFDTQLSHIFYAIAIFNDIWQKLICRRIWNKQQSTITIVLKICLNKNFIRLKTAFFFAINDFDLFYVTVHWHAGSTTNKDKLKPKISLHWYQKLTEAKLSTCIGDNYIAVIIIFYYSNYDNFDKVDQIVALYFFWHQRWIMAIFFTDKQVLGFTFSSLWFSLTAQKTVYIPY